MTAVTCVYPTAGTLTTPVAAGSTTLTLNANDVLAGGVLTIIAGATPADVTLTDPGHTPAGTAAGAVTPVTVAASTARSWGSNTLKNYIDQSNNTVTVTLSSTATITVLFLADGD